MSSRVKTFVLLVTVAGSISVAWSQSAQQLNQRLWNIGKEQLFLSCSGKRHGEVVILEAGRGRTSTDWSKVQPEVARFTEVCSYDRAGLGRDPKPCRFRLTTLHSPSRISTSSSPSPPSARRMCS